MESRNSSIPRILTGLGLTSKIHSGWASLNFAYMIGVIHDFTLT